jgi:hypothetical protein
MSWTLPKPRDTWSDREKGNFAREIWSRIRFASVTFTPAAVTSMTATTYLIAQSGGDVVSSVVVGLRKGMAISATWPAAPSAGLVLDCWCDLDDTLKIRFSNFSGVNLTPLAGAYAFCGMVI